MKNTKEKKRSALYAQRFTSSGTTLVELIIYMGILTALLIPFTQLFGSALDVRRETEAVSYTLFDSRYIFSKLKYDIANADSISTPSALGSQSAVLTIVKSGINHSYQLSGGRLLLDGVALNGHSTTISNVSFLRLGNLNGKHSLRASFTVTGLVRKSSGSQETKTITTTFGLR